MSDGLNGQTLLRGETYYITLTLSDPLADHPMNPDGFNSSNYELSFEALQNPSHPISHETAISLSSSRFTVTTDTTAELALRADDTAAITISRPTPYYYKIWARDTSQDPVQDAFAIMKGQFTLTDR